MARIRTIKPGVGIISPHGITRDRITPDELRRGEGMVYAMLDASWRVVYIGVTESPLNRFQAHRADKVWWPEIEAIYYIAGLPARAARALEAQMIREERPRHNRTVRAHENPKHET